MMSPADPRPGAPHAVAQLPTGIPGFDEILGGGLPALSFNLLAGGPGTGKTTMAMQLLFATATTERPGLFITLLGETSLKMMRYQQCFRFFDAGAVGDRVHFLNLSEEALDGDLDAVLARIVHEVDALHPGIVVVDSFRSLVHAVDAHAPDRSIERFVQRLALHLTTWDITSILIGEYQSEELRNPVFTVADGIVWLTQDVDHNSVVRKLQVVKSRGTPHMPGLHTLRITDEGVQLFPRQPVEEAVAVPRSDRRLSTGIDGLDPLLGGGIPAGASVVLAGPTGAGKTTFAMQFVLAGLAAGESAVVAVFEERPDVYLARASRFGSAFADALADGRLRVIYLRPLDLSVDETLQQIKDAVRATGATRVVLDSINGFEMALAPTFRADFRESLYRLIGALTSLGVTMYSTIEVARQEVSTSTGYRVSFLTDVIISQRYVEIAGEVRKVLLVDKMRGSDHSRLYHVYESSATGIALGETLREYDRIDTGLPVRSDRRRP